MESLRNTSIAQITAIPGLFISDRFAARSLPLLESHNIRHVLSIARIEDVPSYFNAPSTEPDCRRMEQKHIDIDDDPTEDLLIHLNDACNWIDAALRPSENDACNSTPVGVLVHCTQGISRSGSVVIAYLMRTLSLSYSSALGLARSSRALISPNTGFERQLRIWESCNYDIYDPRPAPSTPDSSRASVKLCPAYLTWRAERDALLAGRAEAVHRVRTSAMASMAAEFGRRRQSAKMKQGSGGGSDRVGELKRGEGEEGIGTESTRR